MANTPPGWYPDPAQPAMQRYFDGNQWTQHVSGPAAPPAPAQPHQGQAPHGQYAPQQGQPHQAHQAPAQQPHHPQQPAREERSQLEQFAELDVSSPADPSRVQQQVQEQAGIQQGAAAGGGTLFTEPVLVINQKAKLIELNNEYAVYNQHGQQLAAVVQVGQSAAKKVIRFLGNYDQFFTHKLEIRDGHGQVLLRVTRPAKLMKSRVIVERGDGSPVGEIVQENVFGRINFSIQVNGHEYGKIVGENWLAWNFAIVDHTKTEVARITKTFEGAAKMLFTTADNYVLQIHRPLADPLMSLVVASALTVDTALKQDGG